MEWQSRRVTLDITIEIDGVRMNLPTPPLPKPFWLDQIKHQGVAAFNPDSTYQVFRNVKDFGAKGNGKADDTAAINNAISAGGRCEPGKCNSSTITPAIVYFPPGTYLVSSSIIDYYYTQLIGNPNTMPILKATKEFKGFGIIDGDRYGANGLEFVSTNVFYRQVRNFVFHMTEVPATTLMTGIHWPTSQATSLQNCIFLMSEASGTQHQGMFIESGSGGFLSDLEFYGGNYGLSVGNQQFTMRNIKFANCVTAINQFWSWGWTYMGIGINNCTTGLNMSNGGAVAQAVGSVTFIDSVIENTKYGIITAHNDTSLPLTAGSLVLENLKFRHVETVVLGSQGPIVPGNVEKITAWGQGHQCTPDGIFRIQDNIKPIARPASLTKDRDYYTRSKPQYGDVPPSKFISVRAEGAKGDGQTDDTLALKRVFHKAAAKDLIVFIDAGTYKVTNTIHIPGNSKIVGEAYPVILGYGSLFSLPGAPRPIIEVGRTREKGTVELSDFIVSTQGATAGAILIQWNIASPPYAPSGMWDVHTRIGGFKGSRLSVKECPAAGNLSVINEDCLAAFASMYISPSGSGLYMENVWLWIADHDLDDGNQNRITVHAGRGLYSESREGNIWLVGTSSEHHVLYQYQLSNTKNVFASQLQTETAYYQPNSKAAHPVAPLRQWNDPIFPELCHISEASCHSGWGLRVLDSIDVSIYGAGLYSFFNNYSTECSKDNKNPKCQARIFGVDGRCASNINIYNLNTIGSQEMITRDGKVVASAKGNENVYPNTIAIFRSGEGFPREDLK
ncbi:glycoside hydrolase family 55 protein [Amylocarpus encephaloides]|uniref:Glycoside hydrolase family 55 protein n=1 Tax=Amylocarpus encephaloides TaxID=45428 RepID=A0A9P7Y8A6_9HELO|nr:glycoside hydrolase family 55 protein [Amylocarpus encephaloides]